MIHWLLRGHWPRWFRADYDGLTWRYRCVYCDRWHPDNPAAGGAEGDTQ